MKKLLFFLLPGLFLALSVKADTEPGNDTPGTTTDVLTMGGSQAGSLGGADTYDYYQLTSGADGNITISLTNNNNAFTFIYLFDADGTTQLGTTANFAGSGISFTANGLAAGNYYAAVYATTANNYILSASLTPVPVVNDAEPNDNPAQAVSLTINSSTTGHIGHRFNGGTYDNDDYFIFSTTADGDITISLTNTNNAFTFIYLYDNDGTTQLGTTANFAGSGIAFTSTGLAAGTYYARVYGSTAFSGYTLSANLTPNPFINDNINNSFFSTAIPFAQNDSITGHIAYRNNGGSYDYYDYYSFYSNGDYDITVSLITNNNAFTYIYLYDTDTTTQLGTTANFAGSGISFTTNGLAAGTYYIVVYAGSGQHSGYKLKNNYTANPIAPDIEPNNTIATATPVTYNSVNTGHIAYRNTGGTYDNFDHYIFTTPVDGDITLSLTNNNNAFTYLYLYDSDGTTLLTSTANYAQSGISFTKGGLAAGTYYAVVYAGATQYSGYTLTKTLTPSPFTADAEPNATTGTALAMAVNSSLNGHISHRNNGGIFDEYDYYQIVTTQDGNMNLNLTNNNNGFTYLYLYDSDGVTQLNSTANYAQSGIGITTNGLAAGTYYAVVYAGSAFSSYTLANTLTVAPFNNDVESNNTFATASILNNNTSKQGHIGYRFNGGTIDTDDYWKVTMNSTDSLRLDLTFTSGNFHYVYFYNSVFNQIYAFAGYGDNSIFFNSLPAGDYYLSVYATSLNSYRVNNFYYPCDSAPSVISAGGPTTFCAGGSVSLNSAGVYNSYNWSNGATTGSISAASTGSYTLTAYDFDGCPHVSNTITVTVNPNQTWYVDADSDTYGNPLVSVSDCNQPTGYVSNNSDCNDANAAIKPGATELCNGIDDDCDTSIDEGLPFNSYYNDLDGDNYGTGLSFLACVQPPNSAVLNGDCDDTNAAINPLAIEVCDFDDNDCDGFVDEGFDVDGDSHTSCGGDCNDNNPTINPSATEVCNTIDDNCNALVDEGYDADGDSYTWCNGDCNDLNAAIHPGVTELCNGFDDDCDGLTDEGCTTFTFFRDFDTDGYGNPGNSTTSINPIPPSGYVADNTDCNDNNAAINPGATEIVADNIDQDCNASELCYNDTDNDNFGSSTLVNSTDLDCTDANEASVNGDCNDNNAAINPLATEICNNADDDCDAMIDEGVKNTYYADADADTYGNLFVTTQACTVPPGFVSNSTDCNDVNSAINPGATELCNGVDDDCDAMIDEGCGGCTNPPTVNAGMDQAICVGDNASLNAVLGGGASSITWSSPTNGVFIPNDNAPVATYVPSAADITNGFVRLYITTNTPANCNAAIDSVDISILQLLATPGIISGTQNICNPSSSATFTYSVAPVSGATGYFWTAAPNTTILSGQGSTSIVVKFNPAAIHNGINSSICVAATGPGSCGTSLASCLSVSVQVVAPVTPGSISGPNKTCPGDTAIYSISYVSRSAYYIWTVPANASIVVGQGTQTIKVAYGASFNGGNVTVAAANGCGVSPLRTRAILVNTLPAPTAITGQASGLCNEQNVMYSITPVAGATSYQWLVGTTAVIDGPSNGTSVAVDFSSFVNDNISVVAINGCGMGAARSLSLTGTPAAAGMISGPVTVCTGSTNTYQVNTVTGASSYFWTVPSGTTIINGQGTKIINLKFNNTPAYNMVVSVRTSNSCGNGPLRSLGSIAALTCIRESSDMPSVKVSPNPASEILNIDLSQLPSENMQLILTDVSGRIVFDKNIINEGNYETDITTLPEGIYILQVISGTYRENIKVIKN
jgi:PKD-like domain/Putative metal-binding motif/Secretion system C-terminal sorting domain/Bacterial pre-peptidase C-terminal domain